MTELYVVRIETDAGFAPLVEAGLELLDIRAAAWHEEDTGRVRFEDFLRSREEAERRVDELRECLCEWSDGAAWSIHMDRLPAEGWQERWKEHFHAARVSERIVIKPSWESWSRSPGDLVIELDPGMSFGTGLHATTRACLRFLDEVSRDRPGGSFLDLGCGSGILSIAAAKLGFSRIDAVDCDSTAIETTRRNLAVNGVGDRVVSRITDLACYVPEQPFDVVAANLFADVLSLYVTPIVASVAASPGGRLILSGILSTQYPAVRRIYEEAGLRELQRETRDEWTSGCYGR